MCFWKEAGGLGRGAEMPPRFPLHLGQPPGTPSVGGWPVSQNLQGGGAPLCPCPVLPRYKICLAGECGETPAARHAGGLSLQWGQWARSRCQADKTLCGSVDKSHTTALGRMRAFQMVSNILSDFSLEPESSWLIAGEDGVLEGGEIQAHVSLSPGGRTARTWADLSLGCTGSGDTWVC